MAEHSRCLTLSDNLTLDDLAKRVASHLRQQESPCLPSRLSRVRISSPAPPIPLDNLTSSQIVTFSSHLGLRDGYPGPMVVTIQDAVGQYALLARASNQSEKAIAWVRDSVRYLEAFLGCGTELSEISVTDVRRWIAALRGRKCYAGHPFSPSKSTVLSSTSVNNYVRGIRLLFSTLVKEGVIPDHPVARIKPPKITKKVIQPLTEVRLKRIFEELGRTAFPFRNRAIVALLLDDCLRLSEVVGLTRLDVNFNDGEIRVLGKGDKERILPLSTWSAQQLRSYLSEERPEAKFDQLFLDDANRPLTPHAVQLMLRRIAKITGIRCNPHTFRHTGALWHLRGGMDPFRLQRLLGHTDLAMTKRYVALSDADLRDTFRRSSPGDKLRL